MPYTTDDLRIKEIRELTPPSYLIREFPCGQLASSTVHIVILPVQGYNFSKKLLDSILLSGVTPTSSTLLSLVGTAYSINV